MAKLAYLALFPGMLFLAFAGVASRSLAGSVPGIVLGGSARGPSLTVPDLARTMRGETVAAGGSLHAVMWLAPVLKLAALSWASCVLFGRVRGDLTLLFSLLVLAGIADLLLFAASTNPRVRRNAPAEAWALLGWALPLGIVLAALYVRTGAWTVQALVAWQVANGAVLGSAQGGGALVVTGGALSFTAACVCMVTLARLRPLGRGLLSDPPSGAISDISGAPLALVCLGEGATLFLAALLPVALFLAGSASTWYGLAFWALKVAGLVLLAGVLDLLFARSASRRAAFWALGAGGVLSLAGLVLIWLGVRA
ncbi:MAG: NADH-quinone oxidoreductase subunit H [Actinomycetota bacterium]